MNICRAQVDADSLLALIPDSTFEAGTILVWFQDGYLDPSYLGCGDGEEGYEYPWVDGLPLSTDFILDESVVGALENLGVYRIDKLTPYLDPCSDTISIAVRGDTVYIPKFYNVLVLKYDGDLRAPEACWGLVSLYSKAIIIAEPNFYFTFMGGPDKGLRKTAARNPNDPQFGTTVPFIQRQLRPFTDLDTNVSPHQTVLNGGINAVGAWDRITGDSTIVIGMIDAGVSDTLQTLGYPNTYSVVGGYNFASGNPNAWNVHTTHGDYTTSIIGSITNDGIGLAGVVGGWSGTEKNSRIVALKVGHMGALNDNPKITTTTPAIIAGATRNPNSQGSPAFGCEFLNMSLRADLAFVHSEIVRAALAYAYVNDVVSLAAMGNDGYNHDAAGAVYLPADLDDRFVVGVAGSTGNGFKASQSDFGSSTDFAAPFHVHAYAKSLSLPGLPDYNQLQGTSGATPLVTGGFALLRAYQKFRYNEAMAGNLPLNVPDYLAPEDYQNIFAISAKNKEDSNYPSLPDPQNLHRSLNIGYGVIDVGKAMEFIEPPYSLVHLELSGELNSVTIDTTLMYIAMPGNYKDPGIGLGNFPTDSLYEVIRDSVYAYLPYGKTYAGTIMTWTRGGRTIGLEHPAMWNMSGSLSQRYPLYRNANWCELLSWGDNYCEAYTYLYKVRPYASGGQFDYMPGYGLSDVRFAISLIHSQPVSVPELPDSPGMVTDIYPSPVSNITNIRFEMVEMGFITIDLYDLLGRNLMRITDKTFFTQGVHNLQFDSASLPGGTYFIRTNVNGVFEVKKFVKLR